MKWVRNFKLFTENKSESTGIYNNKNIVSEICVAMLLINPGFLDNILDKGLKARYSENSQIFLTDLKNLLMNKNRLFLGKFVDGKCVGDEETSKINNAFETTFSIEENWSDLVNSRITARNIIDKLLPDEKLEERLIRAVYWIGPNKTKEYSEDLVLELEDGTQYSFFINKNSNLSKTASFNTLADTLIGDGIDKLYNEEYITKWNKLTQEWVRIIYENSNKNIQLQIEKFIDPKRIDTIGYYEYYDIRHGDPRYKHLGEFIREFDKNILKFSNLLSEIWKNRDACFSDPQKVYEEWMEKKIFILNSKILEHLLTESLKSSNLDDIKKLEDGMKLAEGPVKMKFIKNIVEKLGLTERVVYQLGNNGNVFHQMPSRDFFRKYYEDLKIKFDYHVKFLIDKEEENNDFRINVILELDEVKLINLDIIVKFSGGEMSGKLSAKHKFELSDDFNYRVSNKTMLKADEESE
jgi:hypothetical protein